MAVDIVYETHATTTDNEAGRTTGWLPGELSTYGRKCARELGVRRGQDGLNGIICSDLGRAVETVELAFSTGRIPIHRDTRLRTCDFGRLTGMPVSELVRRRRQHVDQPFPAGQSYRQVVDQTRSLLRDLARFWDGRRVLLVAHSANRWALEHLLHGKRLEDLLDEPYEWRQGWAYRLPTGWTG